MRKLFWLLLLVALSACGHRGTAAIANIPYNYQPSYQAPQPFQCWHYYGSEICGVRYSNGMTGFGYY